MTYQPPFALGTVTLINGSADIVGNDTAWAVNGVTGGLMTVEAAKLVESHDKIRESAEEALALYTKIIFRRSRTIQNLFLVHTQGQHQATGPRPLI